MGNNICGTRQRKQENIINTNIKIKNKKKEIYKKHEKDNEEQTEELFVGMYNML